MAKVFRNASLLLVATTTATALTSSELSPSGGSEPPGPRQTAKGCVDTSNSKLLIHGGQGEGAPLGGYGDLWEYDLVGNSWTALPQSGDRPDARFSHVAAMDTKNSKLLIHGGTRAQSGMDDLWAYDLVGNSWTMLEPSGDKPTERHSHVAAMDTKNSKLLIHGGATASGYAEDLWAYDLVGDSWTALSPSGAKPPGRYNHVAAMDTKNSKLLIHGGFAGSALDDLWAYDLVGDSWTALSPSGDKPSARYKHVAAMDTSNSRLLIHGGSAGSGGLDDLWAYDLVGDSWTMLEPSGATPSGREGHVAGIADGSRLIIFGGYVSSTTMDANDVWQFAWVTSTTTTTTTSMTNTTTKSTSTSMTATSTSTTVTTTAGLEVSKCSAPSLFFPLFCVAGLATM